MAKTTTKKTTTNACEEYVVDELKQAKREIEMLRNQLANADKAYRTLVNVVVRGTKEFELDTNDNPDFDYLYYGGSFMTTIWKDRNKEDLEIKELLKLIETGHLLFELPQGK